VYFVSGHADACGEVCCNHKLYIAIHYTDSSYPVKDLDESDTDSSGIAIVCHGGNVKIEAKLYTYLK